MKNSQRIMNRTNQKLDNNSLTVIFNGKKMGFQMRFKSIKFMTVTNIKWKTVPRLCHTVCTCFLQLRNLQHHSVQGGTEINTNI